MPDDQVLITSQTPTAAHLSRLAYLAEQLVQLSDELAYLFRDDTIQHDLTGAESDALRQAAAAARTAGGDTLLVATAAHLRNTGRL